MTLILLFAGFVSPRTEAAMPTKVKAMVTMAAYGTAGGALLGFASMAFGTKPINIARGASLGLYAGILFGAYIVLSYQYRNAWNGGGDYGGETPYQDSSDDPGAYGGDANSANPDRPQRWGGGETSSDFFKNRQIGKEKRHTPSEFSLNVFSFSF